METERLGLHLRCVALLCVRLFYEKFYVEERLLPSSLEIIFYMRWMRGC